MSISRTQLARAKNSSQKNESKNISNERERCLNEQIREYNLANLNFRKCYISHGDKMNEILKYEVIGNMKINMFVIKYEKENENSIINKYNLTKTEGDFLKSRDNIRKELESEDNRRIRVEKNYYDLLNDDKLEPYLETWLLKSVLDRHSCLTEKQYERIKDMKNPLKEIGDEWQKNDEMIKKVSEACQTTVNSRNAITQLSYMLQDLKDKQTYLKTLYEITESPDELICDDKWFTVQEEIINKSQQVYKDLIEKYQIMLCEAFSDAPSKQEIKKNEKKNNHRERSVIQALKKKIPVIKMEDCNLVELLRETSHFLMDDAVVYKLDMNTKLNCLLIFGVVNTESMFNEKANPYKDKDDMMDEYEGFVDKMKAKDEKKTEVKDENSDIPNLVQVKSNDNDGDEVIIETETI